MDSGRRLNPRLEIELPAQYRVSASDPHESGRIANLSVGGAAVLTRSQLPPHSLLREFRFALPGEAPDAAVETTAVVVHAHPRLDDRGDIEYLSGLHFLGLETSTFERLERFVQEHLDEYAH